MTTQIEQRLEVSRAIAADAATIFALLRDPNGHVAVDATGMLMAASGEPAQAVGDTFVVHMDRDALRDFDLGEYDVIVTYVTYEPDREIAWTVGMAPGQTFGHTYGYRLGGWCLSGVAVPSLECGFGRMSLLVRVSSPGLGYDVGSGGTSG